MSHSSESQAPARPEREGSAARPADGATGFWAAGPGLDELEFRPFAADDPESLPRRLGRLPGDSDGRATERLLELYGFLADAAEHEALKGTDS